jgi:hypothetical protein
LQPDSLQNREHLHDNASGDDEQIALSGAESHDLGAEPCEVVPGSSGGHEFDTAAGGSKRHWPQAVGSGPVGSGIKPRDENIFRQAYRHRNTPFRHA